jgi:hypothetical protein
MLITDYSGHPSQTFPSAPPPAYSHLDEAAYYLAYEHERAGDLPNARRVYLGLIVQTPSSRFIPMAYLAFGEMFASEAQNDPTKWVLAQAAYAKVLETPPPANEVYGYAWYRLGQVFSKQGDRGRARNAMMKAIQFASSFPQLRGSWTLGIAAQEQMMDM